MRQWSKYGPTSNSTLRQLGEKSQTTQCSALSLEAEQPDALQGIQPGVHSHDLPHVEEGTRIRVFWSGMKRWYHGTVGKYDETERKWHVSYDDGDQQEEPLADPTQPTVGGAAPHAAWQIGPGARGHAGGGERAEKTTPARRAQGRMIKCINKCI